MNTMWNNHIKIIGKYVSSDTYQFSFWEHLKCYLLLFFLSFNLLLLIVGIFLSSKFPSYSSNIIKNCCTQYHLKNPSSFVCDHSLFMKRKWFLYSPPLGNTQFITENKVCLIFSREHFSLSILQCSFIHVTTKDRCLPPNPSPK